jgi:hypothetical protein
LSLAVVVQAPLSLQLQLFGEALDLALELQVRVFPRKLIYPALCLQTLSALQL